MDIFSFGDLDLGASGNVALFGTWNFTGATVSNLITDTESDHNHGIPNGTVLTTATGSITWVASGGHSHTVQTT